MINVDLCRKRANRLLRRAARLDDPQARMACEDEARSWMSLARVARWGEFFAADQGGGRILN
ncbi:MAG: hypothetical protein JSR86_17350 [Proteobacteria bacterium]|nr:hypothetical protein [Pseudomonadota bacterium]